MLSDAGAEIIPAFGLANPQFAKGSAWYGVALPIVLVIAPDGTVRHRFSETDYRHRVDTGIIHEILSKNTSG